ncbi:O-palmitoleoyl-L-serine hydrolase, partial [Schistosoma bovis]
IPFSLRQYTTLYYIIIIIIIIITWLDNVKAKPSYYKSFIYTTEHNTTNNNKNNNNNNHNNDSWNMIEPWEPLKKPIENQLNQFNNDHKHNEWNNIRLQYQSHQLYLLNNNGAKFGGILSSDPNANPIYHEFHSVFIPYCSSDLWTGKMANRSGDFYFHGSRILAAVIDNIPWQNAAYTEKVIFAGSSAGGIGVLMNIDRLSRKLFNRIGYPVLVSGIIDSS